MKLLFMGTPAFALPSLELIRESRHRLAGIVTRPDRPRGRGRRLSVSPVKEWALKNGVALSQPAGLKDPSFWEWLEGLAPDLVITVAYGKILPPALLDYPPLGCINLHASLLPAYRGAAPIHRAVMAGEESTGVTVIKMNPQMDAGDIILQEAVPIRIDDTTGTLHDRLASLGARLLLQAVDQLASGEAVFKPQDHAAATLAPPLTPEEERLDWRRSAWELYNQIRGLNPRPGAFTFFRGRRLKIWRAAPPAPEKGPGEGRPGELLAVSPESFTVAAGDGALTVLEVQPEGKKAISAGDFCRGYRVAPGERFDSRE
ncbi:MAG: methionyl-tRNA formyltransferase [Firmicutes bacterium]|nr:methionyl-tRNA formyltransferase [Bacillota bacterium]